MDHDCINLQRLTARLEAHVNGKDIQDHYEWLRLQATHQHALELLARVQSNPPRTSTSRTAAGNGLDGLQRRLVDIKDVIEAQKQVKPVHASRPRRPSFLKPAPPTEDAEPTPTLGKSESLNGDPLPPLNPPSSPPRRSVNLNLDPKPSEQPLLRNRKAKDAGTKDISNLLDHQRELQESLTADLTGMAKQLKLNSLHFQSSLQKDRDLVEGVEAKMTGNLDQMGTQRTRLGAVQKKTGWTTCYVVMAVAVVCAAWFFMFALMRIT